MKPILTQLRSQLASRLAAAIKGSAAALLLALPALCTPLGAIAQQVSFASPEFEYGVKLHLGLDTTDVVVQAQTDTITCIDLSGLSISDLRDVVYLPNVRSLNLGQNLISDVSHLVCLDSLRYLDLRANELEDISALSMSSSDSMTVNVAYNYIMDFGRMALPSRCRFTLVGRFAQTDRNAPTLDVRLLMCGFEGNEHRLFYRGYSNQQQVHIGCNGKQTTAIMDGDVRSCPIPGGPATTSLARLTDGTRGDSVWVVPPQRFSVNGGGELTIATGLPEDYAVFCVMADKGLATQSGQTLTYQAPAMSEPDTITFSYYQGNVLRGVARYLINTSHSCDVNGDGEVDISDVNAACNVMLGKVSNDQYDGRADVNGNGEVDIADINAIVNAMLGRKRL